MAAGAIGEAYIKSQRAKICVDLEHIGGFLALAAVFLTNIVSVRCLRRVKRLRRGGKINNLQSYKSQSKMKKILFFLCIISQLACKKNCEAPTLTSDPCSLDSLKIIDTTCFDLRKYVIRNDTSSLFGHATAIKSVAEKGEIEWVSNNSILHFPNEHYLILNNYLDTAWVGLESWAFLREYIIVRFNPYVLGRQTIFDENSYNADSTANYAKYLMWFDDYAAGSWDIAPSKSNYLSVTAIDQVNKIIEGEFGLHFILKEQSTVPGVLFSDKITFRCGHFKSKIIE